jgi:hypothetical protein
VDLRGRDFVLVEPKLVRQQGTLRITSQPAGVSVSVRMLKSAASSQEELQFVKEGPAPLGLENLPTGEYEVRFSYEGAPGLARVVDVSSGASASCAHEFSVGVLTLKTTPVGQEAVVFRSDGSIFKSAKTPKTFEGVPVGAYKVVMKREGFADHVEEFTLAKGGNITLSHEFSGMPLKKPEPPPKEGGAADVPPGPTAAPVVKSPQKPPPKAPSVSSSKPASAPPRAPAAPALTPAPAKPQVPAGASEPTLDEFLRKAQSFERR